MNHSALRPFPLSCARLRAVLFAAMAALFFLPFQRVAAVPGDVDATFNPGASSAVTCAARQADGKILIGGDFTTVGGAAHTAIARLNANGTVDATFNPVITWQAG